MKWIVNLTLAAHLILQAEEHFASSDAAASPRQVHNNSPFVIAFRKTVGSVRQAVLNGALGRGAIEGGKKDLPRNQRFAPIRHDAAHWRRRYFTVMAR